MGGIGFDFYVADHEVAFPTCGGCVDVEVDGLVLVDVGVVFAEAGAEVVGVATVVDRATGADEVIKGEGLEYRYLLGLDDLGLA